MGVPMTIFSSTTGTRRGTVSRSFRSRLPSGPSAATLGTLPNHEITVDHNLLTSASCAEIDLIITKVTLSGATFSYLPQGNFSMYWHYLPNWPDPATPLLIQWIDAITQDEFLPLSCP